MTTIPFGRLVTRLDTRAGGEADYLPLLSVSQTHGVVRFSELHDGEPRAETLENYKLVETDDIVLNRMSVRAGAVGIVREPGLVTPDYEALRVNGGVDPRFIKYLMKSSWFVSEMVRRERGIGAGGGQGVRTSRISFADMRVIPIERFTLDVQRAIADYLDHETAEIDAFIADLELMRQRSEEHRWSKLGTSLGYPAEFLALWERSAVSLASLKHLGSVSLGKMLDTAFLGMEDYLLPYLRAANVQPNGALHLTNLKQMRFTPVEKERLTLRAGDVVVVEGGVGGFGRAAYVREELPDVGYQNSIVRFRPDENTDGRYVTYCLLYLRQVGYISTVASVTSMPHFTAEKVAETPIPRVSLEEQRAIADALDSEWSASEEVEADISAAASLALERRAALISAVVTGQVEVPNRMKPAVEGLEDEIRGLR